MKMVPTLVLSVPYSAKQTNQEASRNLESVRWAQRNLAQIGFNSVAPVLDSVHFQITDDTNTVLPTDEWSEWCHEAIKQQILYGMTHGTLIFFPNVERCTYSLAEIKAAELAAERHNKWVLYLDYEDGMLVLPDNLMDLHAKFMEQQEHC